MDSGDHCSSFGHKGPNAVCVDRHGWHGLQIVYGATGQYERPVDEMQEGPVEAIQIWFDLGIILFPVGANDTTVCLTFIC